MKPSPYRALLLLATAALPCASAGAQANVKGAWDAPVQLQIDGVHAALVPSGEVLFLPHRESPSGLTTAARFDPLSPGGASYTSLINHFCGGHSQLADGRQLFVGGSAITDGALREASTFDFRTGTWASVADMNKPRWYPSAITLGDGKVWVFGGQSLAAEAGYNDNTIEFYDPLTDTWTLAGGHKIPGQYVEAYNRLHLLADGRVFQSGQLPDTYLYDPVARTFTFVDQTNLGKPRGDGASVLLQDGRVMIVGGYIEDTGEVFKSAEVIDPLAPNAQWTSVASMKSARTFIDAVLLPDGNVFVVGGDTEQTPAARTPELYDPVANTWTNMALIDIPRGYHSTALLLPDARVMCGGGEGQGGPGLYEESAEFEIWSPYYLFKTPRPVIDSLPSTAAHGEQLTLRFSSSIPVSHVVVHRTGSGTHSFNYNQVSVPVQLDTVAGQAVRFTVPDNTNLLPPGYYMVFLMSEDGVPSVASWLRITNAQLGVAGLAGGSAATVAVSGVTPAAPVAFAYSLVGPGPVAFALPCGSVQVELAAPTVLGTAIADAGGRASIVTSAIPPFATGLSIWLDALDLASCLSPKGLATSIQ